MNQSGDLPSSLFDWDTTIENRDGGGNRIVAPNSFAAVPLILSNETAAIFNESSATTPNSLEASTKRGNSHRSVSEQKRGGRSSPLLLKRERIADSEDDPENSQQGNLIMTVSKRASMKHRAKRLKVVPKRPLSAYGIFFQEERPKVVEEQSLDSHGSVKSLEFEELSKIIGKRWRRLSSSERKKYEDLAQEDALRYRKEMETFSVEKHHEKSSGQSSSSGTDSVSQAQTSTVQELPAAAPSSSHISTSHLPTFSSEAISLVSLGGAVPANTGSTANPGDHQALSVQSAPTSLTLSSALSVAPGLSLPMPSALPQQPANASALPQQPPNALGGQLPIPPGGQEIPMECLPSGLDQSQFLFPPGMELSLPDQEGKMQKYKLQYTCYAMSSQAAQSYVESSGHQSQTIHAPDSTPGLQAASVQAASAQAVVAANQAGPLQVPANGGFSVLPQVQSQAAEVVNLPPWLRDALAQAPV